jgi:hypothetical protein
MSVIYCIGNCAKSLSSPYIYSLTAAEIYKRYGWFVANWESDSWAGIAYCPDHEEDAMEVLFDES